MVKLLDTKRLVNAEGVSDHTALLPTKNKSLVDYDELDLSDNAKKVLALIYKNLEEATSEPYRYEKTTVTLSYGGEIFTATGVRNLELGWKKNRPDETVEHLLPVFHKGDRIPIKGVSIVKQQTRPPERFTDGKLLQAMESAGKSSTEDDAKYTGIGTAATRADTIEKLVSGGFAVRIGEDGRPKSFAPTALARYLCQVLPDSLKSTELTAEWETKLSEVGEGTLESKAFLNQIKDFTRTTISDAAEKTSFVPKHWEHWIPSDHIIRVVPASKDIAGYLSIFLSSEYGYPLITHYTYGSVVDEIDDTHVSSIPFPLLKNEDVQRRINDLALEANEKRYEAYKMEQQALRIVDKEVIHAK